MHCVCDTPPGVLLFRQCTLGVCSAAWASRSCRALYPVFPHRVWRPLAPAANVSAAFTATFLNASSGEYVDAAAGAQGTQCMQSMPFALGMLPPSPAAVAAVVAALHGTAAAAGGHFQGGMFRWGCVARGLLVWRTCREMQL
jgi:hypothetical protein